MSGPARKKKRVSPLAKQHREYLDARAVAPDIAKERGYRTVKTTGTLLDLGFKPYVPVPGLLIPVMWNNEAVLHQHRADLPRNRNQSAIPACYDDDVWDDEPAEAKPVKFERPEGLGSRLDCHPRMTPSLSDTSVPLFITEGIVKGDALTSVGLCAVAVLGVDNWRGTLPDGTKGVLPDWNDVALDERDVYLAYDADVMTKDGVARARQNLTTMLSRRGARVRWVFLPDPEKKTGVDDYLASGHSAEDLFSLARVPKYSVTTTGRQLPDLTREAVAALSVTNDPPVIFQRIDELVEARKVGVKPLGPARLRYRLAESADWFRATKEAKTPTSPPKELVENVAVAEDHWRFPMLDRIVSTPVFAADGSLRSEPGYHAPSRSLYVPPEGLVVPPVSDQPTKKEIAKARAAIEELFCDFPFVGDADRAHAWALLLQPFARELIRGYTPMFGVEAPKQGTGKSVLVDTAVAPAFGEPEPFSEPHGDEEMEKRLTSVMKEAQPVVIFDNVTRHVHYPSLASALTKSQYQGRELGRSATVRAAILCTWVLTANNPQYSDDMARRVARIRLDAEREDPHRRDDFALSLPSHARENRGELIWAACTLIRAWVVRGRLGPGEDVPKLASYGPWRRVLGGILALHDVPGFLGNLPDPASDEPSAEQEFLRWMFHAVSKDKRGQGFTTKDLVPVVEDEPDLLALLPPGRETVGDRIGKFMRSHKGQRVGDYVLEPTKGKRQSAGVVWHFVEKKRG